MNTNGRLAPWLEGTAPWLAEWVAEENDALEQISREIRIQADEPFKLSPKDLLRIAYSDKFRFRGQAAYALGWSVPPKLLLSFYEQVVLLIVPCQTKREFIKANGLTPEEVAYLYRKGRVLPIIWTTVLHGKGVRYQITDFLKVLIGERPPILERSRRVYDILWSLQPQELHKQEELLRERRLAGTTLHSVQKVPLRSANRWTEEQLIKDMPGCYRMLNCLGYGDLTSEVLRNYETSDAAKLLFLYASFLETPFTDGLGATPQMNKKDVEIASKILPQSERLPKISAYSNLVFPLEIGEFLTDYYDIAFPADPSMEEIDDAYRDNALAKARKVLAELDRLVQKNEKHEAMQKAKDIENVFYEAFQAFTSLERRRAKVKWTLYGMATGAIGVLGIAQPTVGLLAGLGYNVARIRMEDSVATKLASHSNQLAAAIWNFQKEFKSVEALRDTQKRLHRRKL